MSKIFFKSMGLKVFFFAKKGNRAKSAPPNFVPENFAVFCFFSHFKNPKIKKKPQKRGTVFLSQKFFFPPPKKLFNKNFGVEKKGEGKKNPRWGFFRGPFPRAFPSFFVLGGALRQLSDKKKKGGPSLIFACFLAQKIFCAQKRSKNQFLIMGFKERSFFKFMGLKGKFRGKKKKNFPKPWEKGVQLGLGQKPSGSPKNFYKPKT